ncbi:hypothetical protein RRG08_022639 [Elysia crispata]|uniref:Uncharacterized protein n=1 Tax=Elysia crispata TaxID=231223 RepID=A0AAE0Z1J7_9GAST|nr:hypothetical protein RRG08_022639 [Elysia crispata]
MARGTPGTSDRCNVVVGLQAHETVFTIVLGEHHSTRYRCILGCTRSVVLALISQLQTDENPSQDVFSITEATKRQLDIKFLKMMQTVLSRGDNNVRLQSDIMQVVVP